MQIVTDIVASCQGLIGALTKAKGDLATANGTIATLNSTISDQATQIKNLQDNALSPDDVTALTNQTAANNQAAQS